MTTFVSDVLRTDLREAMQGHACPQCGHRHGAISGRVVAVMAGVDQSCVARFLQGRGLSSPVLDKLAAWVQGRA